MDPEETRMLSAADIWAADDIHEETLRIPEWNGGSVRIRALTLEQMAHLATRSTRSNPIAGRPDIIDRELSVALTLVYGMIEPKLTEADVPKLLAKSAAAVTRIVQAINALGVTEDAVSDAAKSDASQRNGALSVFTGTGTGDDAG